MSYIEGISLSNKKEDAGLEFEDGVISVYYNGIGIDFKPSAYQLRKLAEWCTDTADDMEDII